MVAAPSHQKQVHVNLITAQSYTVCCLYYLLLLTGIVLDVYQGDSRVSTVNPESAETE